MFENGNQLFRRWTLTEKRGKTIIKKNSKNYTEQNNAINVKASNVSKNYEVIHL